MRSSALCYVCSASNYKYFLKDKAIITDLECRKMVDHCKDHFDHVLVMIKASLVVLNAFHHVKTAKMRENLNGKQKSLAELEQKIISLLAEQKNKVKSIVSVLNYTETILKKDSNPDQVCSYFLRATARPEIFIVSDIAKYAAGQIVPHLALLNNMHNWSNSRDRSLIAVDEAGVLFSESILADAFTADSVIMDCAHYVGSMVQNAYGKILDRPSENQKAMPFVASFP